MVGSVEAAATRVVGEDSDMSEDWASICVKVAATKVGEGPGRLVDWASRRFEESERRVMAAELNVLEG